MAKSDITQEQATSLVDRIAKELGLLSRLTSGFLKVEGPSNKHRIYIQRSRTLGRIDTTLPVGGEPGTKALTTPNGSITCHIEPDLEHLERFLRMLGDGSLGTQVPNKPRPFAATKQPPRRVPKAVTPAVPLSEVVSEGEFRFDFDGDGRKWSLEERLANIASRARAARVKRFAEERGIDLEEAERLFDRRLEEEDIAVSADASQRAEADEVVRESGLEVE